MSRVLSFAAAAVVLSGGLAATYTLTDGLQAFTTESARRLSFERAPRALPAVWLEDELGRLQTVADWRGKVVILDFFYAGCASVCQSAGSLQSALARALEMDIAAERALLVSVSFDADRDDATALRGWRVRHGGPRGWLVLRPSTAADLARLKRAVGLVAIPDGQGGWVHNAALHVVDAESRIVAAYDLQDAALALAHARALLERRAGA